MYRRTVWEKEPGNTPITVPPGYHGEITENTAVPEPNAEEAVVTSLGFSGGVTPDDLLLCALIFILASDKREGIEDVILVLALLIAVR